MEERTPQRAQDRVADLALILKKPLAFAAKDDYALIDKVKDLDATARRIADRMRQAPDADGYRDQIEEIAGLFASFSTQTADEKREAIARGLSIIEGMTQSRERVPGRTPAKKPPSADPSDISTCLERLKTPVEYIKGVGPRRGELLRKRGLDTVEDLLFLFPRYYIDFRKLKQIRELVHKEQAALLVEVAAAGEKYTRRIGRRIFELIVTDGRDLMTLVWFNAPYMKGRFKNGMRLLVRGVVSEYNLKKSIVHPEVEPWEEESEYQGRLLPRYPLTEGISLKTMDAIVKQALAIYGHDIPDGIPDETRRRLGLMSVTEAVHEIHDPTHDDPPLTDGSWPPIRTLAMDELFLLELGLLLRKKNIVRSPGKVRHAEGKLMERFISALPFGLTGAQRRVLSEIIGDMRSPYPAHRLIQGDVGSGKTVVACAAALVVVEEGSQAALMAPTEILAEQHQRTMTDKLSEIGVRSALLTSSVKGAQRREILSGIENGDIHIVFGTHALISEGVAFRDLGFVVVDEQHRFGVLQRGALKAKGEVPEVIVMTATPIPRTLALTLYGDLDVSVIDEKPPGRIPPSTLLFAENKRQSAYDIIKKDLAGGHQAFFVYPLVEESELLPLKDATSMAQELTRVFPEYRVGLVTGRLKGAEKERIMGEFAAGKIHILVATTVVEVGVDVPNASVMVIEHAERFGLSQLHQLRGRIGRGQDRSTCILLADFVRSQDARRRLAVMTETSDGFVIAEEDLKIRGPGEFMGTRQSGLPTFRAANLVRDYRTLLVAREEALRLLETDPALTDPAHKTTRELVMDRFAGRFSLVDIG